MKNFLSALFLMLAFSVTQSIAEEPKQRPTIDSLIAEEIGEITVEVEPVICRRVYQIIEENYYVVCLIDRDLRVFSE